jgi:hypothetical protein
MNIRVVAFEEGKPALNFLVGELENLLNRKA